MATSAALPLIRPMLATLGPLPTGDGWAYELKWDGVRAVAYLERGRLRLLSRNDRDVSASYPELAVLAERSPRRRLVLDGEIVALDPRGVPSFSLLQQRMHVRAPTPALVARVPARLYLFDVVFDGTSTIDRPYTSRRGLLDALRLGDGVVEVPPYWTGQDGRDLPVTAAGLGLEGVIAKRLTSAYEPGRRSRAWIKAPINVTQEVVIAGWRPGEGRRAGMIGSLLLGAYDEVGRLAYIGQVGTGFTAGMLRDLRERLRPLARRGSPFAEPVPRDHARGATWVEPRLVGEVTYRTLTPDGRLRHPSWRGLRPDKEPGQVLRPVPLTST
jgi:bifunctional non-homologous end joining protein LigD